MGETTEQLLSQAANYPDYIVIGMVFVLLALYGFVRGTKALSELAISLPIAAFVYSIFPYDLGWGEPAMFAIITIAIIWVVARYTSGLDDNKDFRKIAFAALGATLMLLVISFGTVDFTSLYNFGAKVSDTLAIATYKFYIIVAALIAIALSRKI